MTQKSASEKSKTEVVSEPVKKKTISHPSRPKKQTSAGYVENLVEEAVILEKSENDIQEETLTVSLDSFQPKRIVMITSEMHPYAKSGGLADVCASLPAALAERGHGVSVIMPYYPQVMGQFCEQTQVCQQLLKVPFGAWEEWAQIRQIQIKPNFNIYFIEFNRYFDRPKLYDYNNVEYGDNAARYIFFCRAAMETIRLLEIRPDIIHTHDWHAALANVYLISSLYRDLPDFAATRSVLTLHNLGYQGNFDKENLPLSGLGWEYFNPMCLEYHDRLNLLKGGIMTAHRVSTVSPTYAEEILSPEHGFGLEGSLHHCAARGRLEGILNGIDMHEWSPETDPLIPANFSAEKLKGKEACKAELQKTFALKPEPRKPLIGVVSRLASQKGIDVFLGVIQGLLDSGRAQVVILGAGEPALHQWIDFYARKYPGSFGSYIGYSNKLSHLIEAGADFFAMPSRYEPCGLNQMYSMRYGTLPIVRATGGLDDTVINYSAEGLDNATGFKFYDLTGEALWGTLNWAIGIYEKFPEHIRQMQINGMKTDFSWNATARHYEVLYDNALRTQK